jgi:hypothetical protein
MVVTVITLSADSEPPVEHADVSMYMLPALPQGTAIAQAFRHQHAQSMLSSHSADVDSYTPVYKCGNIMTVYASVSSLQIFSSFFPLFVLVACLSD